MCTHPKGVTYVGNKFDAKKVDDSLLSLVFSVEAYHSIDGVHETSMNSKSYVSYAKKREKD